jgi:hypothetical protein
MTNSYKTAIKRKKPSAPAGWLFNAGILNLTNKALDYGCGHGFDADYYSMDKYDPHFFPEPPARKYNVITCTYVLNTVTKAQEYHVLRNIKRLLTRGGSAYITVRRDIKGTIATKAKTYQRNVTLDLPIVHETKGYCIYQMKKR